MLKKMMKVVLRMESPVLSWLKALPLWSNKANECVNLQH